ncbi:MAG: SAM-dependent methyltransferase [Planctomycetota bacterium]|jgi:SAM-dependent methyltransferase
MDTWFYYDVTHALHTFCNPTSAATVDELGQVLGLGAGTRVLDIGCGFGEFLVRWAEQHSIAGVGVDASPYALARAERRRAERVSEADLRFVETRGEDFTTSERFDVAMCVGASWIWNGFAGTLAALRGFARPGGLVVSGEPYWIAAPPDAYLRAEGLERGQFHTLAGCREVALDGDLEPIWMRASSLEEWDRYEMLQAAAVDRFAREQPDHPDLPEIRTRRRKADEIYLRWGRQHCGFALWVFRCAG